MSKILIVEDNLIQRDNLKAYIQDLGKFDVYEAESTDSALEIANDNDIDLFLIDIQLKDSSGMVLAKELRKKTKYRLTWIVFLTTHSKFMINAFKQIHCYDYILKPYSKIDIQQTIQTLLSRVLKEEPEYVMFDKKDMMLKINTADIIFVEVNFRTCTLHTKNGVYDVKRLSLKNILNQINKDFVIKVHRSYAVNINEVDKIEKCYRGCWEISFKNYEKKALLTESFKDNFIKEFGIAEER